jgi:hypothetical protein
MFKVFLLVKQILFQPKKCFNKNFFTFILEKLKRDLLKNAISHISVLDLFKNFIKTLVKEQQNADYYPSLHSQLLP